MTTSPYTRDSTPAADASKTAAGELTGQQSGAENLSDTAFRRAERRFQLHFEHQLRYKKGRPRGGKLVAMPTDLSGVVDIRQPAACDNITAVCLQQQQQQSCSSDTSSTVTGLVFRRHPGMVVFPAAVPADLQLQLMQAALVQWPEPPARTNHTKLHGMTLCQLFQAAQQGLALKQDDPHKHATQQGMQPQQQQQCRPPHSQQCHPGNCAASCQASCQACSTSGQPSCTCDSGSSSGSSSSSSSPWAPDGLGPDGLGPKASVLLRKLRWVCLGPPYDWTTRVYEPHLPHRPLPAVLLELAQRYAALAVQAVQQAGARCTVAGSNPAGGPVQAAAPDAAAEAAAGAGPAAGAAHGLEAAGTAAVEAARSGVQGGAEAQQPCSRMFVPDAALVNYYHAGDTLNGHKDDVEADLRQPIVTLSLGCDAVFLVGGPTRDQEPTALLLRSGDVVVLGQEARACYHGVPRVLTDRPLPQELHQAAAEQCSRQYTPYLQHMQGCRINISVRCTD